MTPAPLLLLAASLGATAAPPTASRQAPGLTATGDFCEVIWDGEDWQRVSCFHISQGAEGVELDGVAYSWARKRDDGTVVAPELATWSLDRVVSYDAATQTLRYAHSGMMTNTEQDFTGETAVSFDFAAGGGTTTGWYGDPERPTRFRLLPLAELEACLGAGAPEARRQDRFTKVAMASPTRLNACVPDAPDAWKTPPPTK